MSTREVAQAYLAQGSTVRAAATMINLIKTEPTTENLALLADIYMEQGLFEEAKELYLSVVRAGLNGASQKKS